MNDINRLFFIGSLALLLCALSAEAGELISPPFTFEYQPTSFKSLLPL
jgi:hypothetical protein